MKAITYDDLSYEDDGTYRLNGMRYAGAVREFYPNGTMRSETAFVDGHPQGLSREWYATGQIEREETYFGDMLHGISKEWHPNGRLRRRAACEYGICLELQTWDESGALTSNFAISRTDQNYRFLEKLREIHGKEGH